jgi:hypothetical protein
MGAARHRPARGPRGGALRQLPARQAVVVVTASTPAAFRQNYEAAAGNLRRALQRVISDAHNALNTMDAGGVPGIGHGAVLSQSATDADGYAFALRALSNLAGSELLSTEDATTILVSAR